MELEIKTLPAMRFAALGHTGAYVLIGPAFHKLAEIAAASGLFALPGAMMVGLYKDEPTRTPPEQLRSAAAILVPEGADIPAGLVEERVDAGRFACLTHIGSYRQLGSSWMRLKRELVPAGGYVLRDATSYEFYLNDPGQVPEPELKTEICVPVE
jgi:AraC family transcriptional regulator